MNPPSAQMTASLPSRNSAPIGAFDSGVGGLTVVRAIRELLPLENIIYLGDTARVPYGNKSPDTIKRYSLEIDSYLEQQNIKALVVACNTASAHALNILQERAKVPVLGVIAPGVQAALAASHTRRIGILGTQGTIQSNTYQLLLRKLSPKVHIVANPAPLLVSLIEENWLDHPATRLILQEYLTPLQAAQVDTIVLACTHYPLLKPLAREILGPDVTLVDSAENLALTLARVLNENDLARQPLSPSSDPDEPIPPQILDPGHTAIRVTDLSPQFKRLAEQFLGGSVPDLEQVTLPSVS